MEKLQGYDEAKAITGEYEVLPAGGYICYIKGAKVEETKTNKKMLVIALDIAEGEKKDYFNNRFINDSRGANAKWPSGAVYRQMLEGEKAPAYLKGVMDSLEKSNEGFKWNWDETKLANLKCGAIFGEEEYEKADGTTGVAVKVKFIRSTEAIKTGNFKIPELKKLPVRENPFADFTSSSDYLPF